MSTRAQIETLRQTILNHEHERDMWSPSTLRHRDYEELVIGDYRALVNAVVEYIMQEEAKP